jgi:hypothetical protein
MLRIQSELGTQYPWHLQRRDGRGPVSTLAATQLMELCYASRRMGTCLRAQQLLIGSGRVQRATASQGLAVADARGILSTILYKLPQPFTCARVSDEWEVHGVRSLWPSEVVEQFVEIMVFQNSVRHPG